MKKRLIGLLIMHCCYSGMRAQSVDVSQDFEANKRAYAQEKKLVSFTSPQAASITSTYEKGVDQYTGKFNLSIPLVSLESTNLSTSLQMSYNSGVNIDEYANWIGQGWGLRTGAISRQVNGYPDELIFTQDYIATWYSLSQTVVGYMVTAGDETPGELINSFNGATKPAQKLLIEKADVDRSKYPSDKRDIAGYDFNPDRFDFYIPSCKGAGGLSGSFYFSPTGEIHVTPEIKGLTIIPTFQENDTTLRNENLIENSIISFTVTTTEGCRYTFAGSAISNALETSRSYTNTSTFDTGLGFNKVDPNSRAYIQEDINEIPKNLAMKQGVLISLDHTNAQITVPVDDLRGQEQQVVVGTSEDYLFARTGGSWNFPGNKHVPLKRKAIYPSAFKSTSPLYTSAWYLTKIEDLYTQDFIDFEYERIGTTFMERSESISITTQNTSEKILDEGGVSNSTLTQREANQYSVLWGRTSRRISTSFNATFSRYDLIKLRTITSKKGSMLEFNSSSINPEIPGDTRLDQIISYNQGGKIINQLDFDYEIKRPGSNIFNDNIIMDNEHSTTKYDFVHRAFGTEFPDSRGFGEVTHSYIDYLVAQDSRLFLKKISVSGSALEGSIPPFEFEYHAGDLPKKFSNQRDAWGFYNSNNSPSGIPRFTFNGPKPGSNDLEPSFSKDHPYDHATTPYKMFSWELLDGESSLPAWAPADKSPNLEAAIIGNLKSFRTPENGRFEIAYELNEIAGGEKVGGLRVKELKTYPNWPSNHEQLITRYTYEDGAMVNTPIFSKQRMDIGVFNPVTVSNQPLVPTILTHGSPVGYGSVTVQHVDQDGKALGKVVSEFINPNEFPNPYKEGSIVNVSASSDEYTPRISRDYDMGHKIKSTVYDSLNNKISEENLQYYPAETDDTILPTMSGLIFSTPVVDGLSFIEPERSPGDVGIHIIPKDPILRHTAKISNIPVITSSAKVSTNATTHYFDNQEVTITQEHFYGTYDQVIKTITTNSSSNLDPVVTAYEFTNVAKADFLGHPVAVLQRMEELKMITPIYNFSYIQNGGLAKLIGATMNHYSLSENNVPLLDSVSVASVPFNEGLVALSDIPTRAQSLFETAILITDYDDNNHILSTSAKNNIEVSYIWGYDNSLPVAQVVNAELDNIFYESFEEYTDAIESSSDSKTGSYYYAGNTYDFEFTPADPANSLMSYWYFKDSKWNYVIAPFSTSISETDATRLDEIRVFPKGAQMTTYTYLPGVGMTSTTDANNFTTYYDYDTQNRLEAVRDHNYDIVSGSIYDYRLPLND